MLVSMEAGASGGGSSEVFTQSGTQTITSSNLSVDTGLGDNLRIFKYTGVATNSYGSDMTFAGEWDSTDSTKCICAGLYTSNGDLVTEVNAVGNGRGLIIASVSNGVVTFKLPTTSGWSTANPSISWKAG